MKGIPIRQLDKASLDYLALVDRTCGGGLNGVFIRCPGRNVSPRVGQRLGLCLGLAVAIVSLAAGWFLDFEQVDSRTAGHLQAILVAIGLGIAAGWLLALRRPVFHSPVGHFFWADARQFWQVAPESVKVCPLEDVRSAAVTHFTNAGGYSHSEVFLRLRFGSEALTVPSRAHAEQLVKFLSAFLLLPDDKKEPDPSLPQPEEVPLAENLAQPGVAGRVLPRSIAVAVAVLGIWLFPRLNGALREDRLYAATSKAELGEDQPFQRYLSAFPAGRYAEEVREAFEGNLARYTARSPLGQADRYEQYFKIFPQGSLKDQVRVDYEDHLYKSAKLSEPGAEGAFRRYLDVFSEGRYAVEVRANYEGNLYKATLGASSSEQQPFRRYLEVFPQGSHVKEVKAAFEDNLARHAAVSPAGDESRYKQYLDLFPEGRSVAGVRAGYEDNLYKFARESPPEEEKRCRRYLDVFPMGRFVSEVRQLYDDCRFTQARSAARNHDSPALLRQYLSDPANQRHRREAQEQIDELYGRAISDLKKRTEDPESKGDKVLAEVLISLLEALKKSRSPVVSVGFKGTQTAEPVDDLVEAKESLYYMAHLRKHLELQELEKANGTAIIPGQVFDATQTARRESLLFAALSAAVRKHFKPDLLTLEPVARDATPFVEIAYHAFPSGTLVESRLTITVLEDGREVDKQTKIVGLLRCYDLEWVIKTRTPVSDKVLEYKLLSRKESSIKIPSEQGDPNWTPYAIDMRLSFRDLSDRFLRTMGIEPDPLPAQMTFREATGK